MHVLQWGERPNPQVCWRGAEVQVLANLQLEAQSISDAESQDFQQTLPCSCLDGEQSEEADHSSAGVHLLGPVDESEHGWGDGGGCRRNGDALRGLRLREVISSAHDDGRPASVSHGREAGSGPVVRRA